jgi:hypothetical protein
VIEIQNPHTYMEQYITQNDAAGLRAALPPYTDMDDAELVLIALGNPACMRVFAEHAVSTIRAEQTTQYISGLEYAFSGYLSCALMYPEYYESAKVLLDVIQFNQMALFAIAYDKIVGQQDVPMVYMLGLNCLTPKTIADLRIYVDLHGTDSIKDVWPRN